MSLVTRSRTTPSERDELLVTTTGTFYAPAAIVSPPRRISILPISLFTAKGSKGIGCGRANGPEYTGLRRVIWTSADVLFVNTLFPKVLLIRHMVIASLIPGVFAEHRSRCSIQRCDQLGYACGDISRMVVQLNLSQLVSLRRCQRGKHQEPYRCSCCNRNLYVEYDDACRKCAS